MGVKHQAPQRSLGRSAFNGAFVTLGGQVVRILVQLSGIVILARLLTPSDYGVLAMVLAVIGFGEIFRDFGLSAAAIQAKEVTQGQKSNLFWLNTAIGLALAGIFCALSGPIALLFGDDRLQMVTIVLSSMFVLNGIATQFRADLNREMRLFRLTTAEVSGQVAGLAAGVTLAVLGFGYWALVAQQLVGLLVQLVAVAFASGWWPTWPTRHAEMGSLIRFGTGLFGSQALGYAARNIDTVVIGSTLGATALGFYNRAFQLMLLPLNQLNAPSTRVALPVLSRLQDDRARFAEFISFGQTVMLNLVGVILAFAAAQASAIIHLALGDQWEPSIVLFQVLTVAGFFQAAGYATYWVFLAKGLTGAFFWYMLASRPIMIALVLAGSLFGVVGVASAYSLATMLIWPIGLLWIRRISDAPVGLIFRNGARTMIAYGAAAGASYAATVALPEEAHVLRLLVGAVALLGALIVFAAVWSPFRRDLFMMADARRYLRRTRSTGAPTTQKETA